MCATFEDKSGNIWLGTDSGASRFDGKSFTNYTRVQGLPSNNVNTIIQDRSLNGWCERRARYGWYCWRKITQQCKASATIVLGKPVAEDMRRYLHQQYTRYGTRQSVTEKAAIIAGKFSPEKMLETAAAFGACGTCSV